MQLLLVEDNSMLASSVARGLGEEGFEVAAVSTGVDAMKRLDRGDIDCVVLDLGLPDMGGLEVVDHARKHDIRAPILVLTSRDDIRIRINALERGADDYMTKPFEYAELLARLRALVRRAAAPRWALLTCNGLIYRDNNLGAYLADERIELSPREHRLLGLFMRSQDTAIPRAEILLKAFGYDHEPGTNLVNVHIANLRRKLGTRAVVIETVRGIGYRLRAATPDDG